MRLIMIRKRILLVFHWCYEEKRRRQTIKKAYRNIPIRRKVDLDLEDCANSSKTCYTHNFNPNASKGCNTCIRSRILKSTMDLSNLRLEDLYKIIFGFYSPQNRSCSIQNRYQSSMPIGSGRRRSWSTMVIEWMSARKMITGPSQKGSIMESSGVSIRKMPQGLIFPTISHAKLINTLNSIVI